MVLHLSTMDGGETSPLRDAHLEVTSSGIASTSSPVLEEDEEELRRNRRSERRKSDVSDVGNGTNGVVYEDESSAIRDDTWTCIVVVLTFWFFVSMTLILGVYGLINVTLGPNTSLLLQPNSIFVQNIKVERLDELASGLMLYGFYESPPLDVVATWKENHNASLPAFSHSLTSGMGVLLERGNINVNISYNVNSSSSSSSSVYFAIAEGSEGFAQWLEDPSYPNTTLSWNILQGNGLIQEEIYRSSIYYIAMSNMNYEDVEMQLNLSVKSLLYNTTDAYSNCSLTYGACSVKLYFPDGNLAVLTSPGPEQGSPSDQWYVKISYKPQWITYLAGVGGFTLLMLQSFNFSERLPCNRRIRTRVRFRGTGSASTPLLSQKDDDIQNWGSSYDSLSDTEDEPEDLSAAASAEGKTLNDNDDQTVTRRLCAICFDAPRDCFFLPCGHCVTCFTCGSRIAEAAGICPVCRRSMRKVRNIFTV